MKLMVLVALIAFIRVLSGSLPERDSVAEVAVVRFSVADMQPGDHQLLEWNNKPLFIVYRERKWESALLDADPSLYRDPDSGNSEQPEFAENALRSQQSGWFVTLGLGTGAGCALIISLPDSAAEDGMARAGGFTDGCDDSRYDLAGRVYSNQAAKRNTVVPTWRLDGTEILVSG